MSTPYHPDLHHVIPGRHRHPDFFQHQTQPVEFDIIIFSHLRWDFVLQRPQHIASRLAHHMKILFVEEPIPYNKEEEGTARLRQVNEHITVMQPRVQEIKDIEQLLKFMVRQKTVPIGWFYSSDFSPLLRSLHFRKIVYDCMSDHEPRPDADEPAMLAEADIVFTDSKALFESRIRVHPNVHCFPSSVEHGHFRKALKNIAVPGDIAELKKPVVGYCGVIDGRLDMDLLDKVAEQSPETTFVLIGPLVNMPESKLPKRSNVHYLGMKPYHLLPGYLKGIDIAMIPFDIKGAHKLSGPTETLEYMAAGKPIISTPIWDVVRDYRNHINIVNNVDEFCAARDAIIKQLESQVYNHEKYNDILHTSSWEDTVKRMEKLIQALHVKERQV